MQVSLANPSAGCLPLLIFIYHSLALMFCFCCYLCTSGYAKQIHLTMRVMCAVQWVSAEMGGRKGGVILFMVLCCTACHAWSPTLDVLPSHRWVVSVFWTNAPPLFLPTPHTNIHFTYQSRALISRTDLSVSRAPTHTHTYTHTAHTQRRELTDSSASEASAVVFRPRNIGVFACVRVCA